jgi:hypothetical protein
MFSWEFPTIRPINRRAWGWMPAGFAGCHVPADLHQQTGGLLALALLSSRGSTSFEPMGDSHSRRIRNSVTNLCARHRTIRIDFEGDRDQRQDENDDQGSHGPGCSAQMRRDRLKKPAERGRFRFWGPSLSGLWVTLGRPLVRPISAGSWAGRSTASAWTDSAAPLFAADWQSAWNGLHRGLLDRRVATPISTPHRRPQFPPSWGRFLVKMAAGPKAQPFKLLKDGPLENQAR